MQLDSSANGLVVEPAGLDLTVFADGPTLTLPAGRGRLHTLRPWTGEVQVPSVLPSAEWKVRVAAPEEEGITITF